MRNAGAGGVSRSTRARVDAQTGERMMCSPAFGMVRQARATRGGRDPVPRRLRALASAACCCVSAASGAGFGPVLSRPPCGSAVGRVLVCFCAEGTQRSQTGKGGAAACVGWCSRAGLEFDGCCCSSVGAICTPNLTCWFGLTTQLAHLPAAMAGAWPWYT